MDYADKLKVSPSYLSHVNVGRKQMSQKKAIALVKMSRGDPRLKGLKLVHLRPDLEEARSQLCIDCKKKNHAK
jgi:hypothetical protein